MLLNLRCHFFDQKNPSIYNGIMATKLGILVFECNSALLVALCIRDNADRADTTQSHRSCNSFWTVDKNFVFPDLQKALIPRNPRFTWSAESRWKAFITALSVFTEAVNANSSSIEWMEHPWSSTNRAIWRIIHTNKFSFLLIN